MHRLEVTDVRSEQPSLSVAPARETAMPMHHKEDIETAAASFVTAELLLRWTTSTVPAIRMWDNSQAAGIGLIGDDGITHRLPLRPPSSAQFANGDSTGPTTTVENENGLGQKRPTSDEME
jgi:hypothetical protein